MILNNELYENRRVSHSCVNMLFGDYTGYVELALNIQMVVNMASKSIILFLRHI